MNNLNGLAGKQGLFIYFMGDFVGGFHSFIRRTPLLHARNYFFALVCGFFQFMRELSLCSLFFFVCARTPLLRVVSPFARVFFNRLQVGFSYTLYHCSPAPDSLPIPKQRPLREMGHNKIICDPTRQGRWFLPQFGFLFSSSRGAPG